jgi:hypothetical protein
VFIDQILLKKRQDRLSCECLQLPGPSHER